MRKFLDTAALVATLALTWNTTTAARPQASHVPMCHVAAAASHAPDAFAISGTRRAIEMRGKARLRA